MLHINTDLRTRAVRGGFWVFALRISNQLLLLARTVVVARLLSPADFGLFGIALLAMSSLENFSQTGFEAALIQKKDDTKSYLNMAWTVQAIRGLLLMLLLFTTASYVAVFFDAPAAKSILQIIGISFLLRGFNNIGVVYFQKDLEFKKQFVYTFSGTVFDVSVAISAVFLLRSVWALVFGLLAGDLVRMLVSYLIHPYRPRLVINQQQFKELFGFGKWILGTNILLFLVNQGDDIFVGKVLGVTSLGLYQLAYRLSNIPATEITYAVSQVTFPVYSKFQDNLPRLRKTYLDVLQLTAFLSFPIAGLILLLTPTLTKHVFGEQWMPMIPAMRILVIWGLIRSLGGTNGPLLQAVGRPDIVTKLSVIKLAIIMTLIYPLSMRWGITGTSLAVLLSALIVTPNTFRIVTRSILIVKRTTIFQAILIPFISTSLVTLCLLVLMRDSTSLTGMISLAVIGITSYLLATYLLDKLLNNRRLYSVARSLASSISNNGKRKIIACDEKS